MSSHLKGIQGEQVRLIIARSGNMAPITTTILAASQPDECLTTIPRFIKGKAEIDNFGASDFISEMDVLLVCQILKAFQGLLLIGCVKSFRISILIIPPA